MSYEKSYFSDKMDYSEFEQRQEDQLKIRNRDLLDDLSLHAIAKKRLFEIAEVRLSVCVRALGRGGGGGLEWGVGVLTCVCVLRAPLPYRYCCVLS